MVRPGGISFGAAYTTSPISPTDAVEQAEGLTLTVSPILTSIPIGAPVRIEFTITNQTDQPLPIPANLTMRGGAVRGRVVDRDGRPLHLSLKRTLRAAARPPEHGR